MSADDVTEITKVINLQQALAEKMIPSVEEAQKTGVFDAGNSLNLYTGVGKFLAPIAEKMVERTGAKHGDLICFGTMTSKYMAPPIVGSLSSPIWPSYLPPA